MGIMTTASFTAVCKWQIKYGGPQSKLRNGIPVNAMVGCKVDISLLLNGRHRFKSFVRHLPETIFQNPFQPYSSDPTICMYFSGTSISSGRVHGPLIPNPGNGWHLWFARYLSSCL